MPVLELKQEQTEVLLSLIYSETEGMQVLPNDIKLQAKFDATEVRIFRNGIELTYKPYELSKMIEEWLALQGVNVQTHIKAPSYRSEKLASPDGFSHISITGPTSALASVMTTLMRSAAKDIPANHER